MGGKNVKGRRERVDESRNEDEEKWKWLKEEERRRKIVMISLTTV